MAEEFNPGDEVCINASLAQLLPRPGIVRSITVFDDTPNWQPAVIEQRSGNGYIVRVRLFEGHDEDRMHVAAMNVRPRRDGGCAEEE